MVAPKKRTRVPPVPPAEAAELVATVNELASSFVGPIDELESAIGMLFLGRLFGWKVLVLVHNKRTIRKYEGILGIDVRKDFPEVGPLGSKSVGLDLAEKAGQFWKAVSGDFRLPERRDIQG
jgi:hypothetical protein